MDIEGSYVDSGKVWRALHQKKWGTKPISIPVLALLNIYRISNQSKRVWNIRNSPKTGRNNVEPSPRLQTPPN
jgi:hypothetical protein